jgi:O-antigen ligase
MSGPAMQGAAGGPAAASARWLDAARWAALVGACTVMVSPPVANAAIVAMLACFVASGQALPRLRHAMAQPLAIGALLVVAVVALGTLWADVPWIERWKSFYTWRKLWIIPVLLALFGPAIWKQRLLAAYVAVCVVAALASFAMVVRAGHLPADQFNPAAQLLRNHAAQSMAFATAAFISLWAAARPQLPARLRLAAVAAASLLALNLAFVTPGRSGYLALAVMLLVLAVASVRGWRSLALVGTLATLFVAALAVSPLARDRIDLAVRELKTVRSAEELSSMGIRVIMYENTLELVRKRPWFGVGSGGFGEAYAAQVQGKYSDWRARVSTDPHNQYLFFLAEQGLVGLLAFLAFIGLALADRGDGGPTRLIAVGMLLAWCATSMLSSHFQTFAEGHLLAFFLGAMLARPVANVDSAPVLQSSGAGESR